jgi:ATP-dependent Clp protease ATP-binding subunit ClpX
VPKNSLVRQYSKLFELEGIKLTFEEEAYDYIVEKAMEFKLGARGLRSICEHILTDAMFEMPSQKVKSFEVTLEYARQKFESSKMSKLKVA